MYRVVPRSKIVPAENWQEGWRPASDAFDAPPGERPSVYADKLLPSTGCNPVDLLDVWGDASLVRIPVRAIRSYAELDVKHVPDADDAHPRASAHCEVVGMPETNKARKRARDHLRDSCKWVILIPPEADA